MSLKIQISKGNVETKEMGLRLGVDTVSIIAGSPVAGTTCEDGFDIFYRRDR